MQRQTMQLSCTARRVILGMEQLTAPAFLQIYLPLFLAGFIILVFVIPSIRVYRQTGINPFRFATGDHAAHDYIGRTMKVFIALLVAVVFLYSFFPAEYQYLVPVGYLDNEAVKTAGLVLVHVSLTGIIIAQRQMKQSWRIGIDYAHKTQLVTSGLFAVSRNPIYLFLLAGLAGLFLLLPNTITFAVLFAAYLVLHIVMRLEEDFLYRQHGAAYAAYRQKVKRLL